MNEPGSPRAILHLDVDAFYPSVEVLDDPSLRGKPVIVGGHRERGVVSSASYEARAYGIHSALPMATALRLCPQGTFLPVRMARYMDVSRQVFELFCRFTPLVEPLSIDEAFLDVTGCQALFGGPEEIALKIKQEVCSRIGITVSAGIAPSKFVAKIASDMNKPDGLTVVSETEMIAFLHALPIEKLWGVGKVTRKRLAEMGVRTVGDLSRTSLSALEQRFGKHGTHLHLLSRGVDDRDVEPLREIKSVGHEDTFAEDVQDMERVRRELQSLAVRVSRRLRRKGLEGRTIHLKVKYHDFVQVTRSTSVAEGTDDGAEIFRNACLMLSKTAAGRKPVRLLGISVSNLTGQEGASQPGLFDAVPASAKKKRLNQTLDQIQNRFGEDSILPGTLVKNPKEGHKK